MNSQPKANVLVDQKTLRPLLFELWPIACCQIVHETYNSSMRMSRTAFEPRSIPLENTDTMKTLFDQDDRNRMMGSASIDDINKPLLENQSFIERIRESIEEKAELSRKMADARDEVSDD